MSIQTSAGRCGNCGGTTAWDGASGQLKCGSCGALADGAPGAGSIREQDLNAALADRKPKGRLGAGARQNKCNECGAVVEFADNVTATRCSFCDSPSVLAQDARANLIQPESLIPFKTTREQTAGVFKAWLGKRWFTPGDLTDRASVSEMRGMYVPFWTFNARVSSSWSADRGYNYQEAESYVDSNQLTQTRTVTKVRWEAASGQRTDRHENHLVCASKGLPPALAHDVERFDMGQLVPYAPHFLSGFSAESYAIELPEAWTQAQRELGDAQLGRCKGDVKGDTQRNLTANHQFDEMTYKHILAPVWIAAFRYGDKVYRFLINGQTGEVSGETPRAWWKLLVLIGAIVAVIAVLAIILHR